MNNSLMDGKNSIKVLKNGLSDHDGNKTIYINNLNDSISIPKQKLVLEEIFAKYGKIESIKMFNSYFRKGQAWITFSNASSAVNAVNDEIGTQIFGRHVNVSFAAKESERRNIQVRNSGSCIQMVPKSINARIELYKQYLAQWLKNAENNGLFQTLSNTEKNQIKQLLNNQVLYDNNYANLIRSNKNKKLNVRPTINNELTPNYLGRPEMQIDSIASFRYRPPNNVSSHEISNTVFVQMEMGTCREEELHALFSHINGFKELRFIPVSF
ncbi:RNA recognition motif family protein [Cryptosporidium meleagridis]|uniref:RNA recognition motif family protein n=1 Tax=Cryptosporidium meleagridis TaxID=93969 RepID=A0A2P4Z3F0_9CRYT|nr:RNA recognition motif family protein [Cryptosporidium meleagridis]